MLVSICTPTCDRRPFIKTLIKCIENQTYQSFEWVILDDGKDKIKDLVIDLPYAKYYTCEKMTIGEKRNLLHKYTKGQILVYFDDDDYYPPERISNVIETLSNGKELCAGSSTMFIYFSELEKIYQFGPYGENHATAATFGFRRELLNQTAFKNDGRAEEKFFLKKWTIPLKQLDPTKTILVISHTMNTVDRTPLLEGPRVKETSYVLEDFISDPSIIQFYRYEMKASASFVRINGARSTVESTIKPNFVPIESFEETFEKSIACQTQKSIAISTETIEKSISQNKKKKVSSWYQEE